MKHFELTKKMLSMGGVFYPTGYAFIMFPDPEDAKQVAEELEVGSDGVMLHAGKKHIKKIVLRG